MTSRPPPCETAAGAVILPSIRRSRTQREHSRAVIDSESAAYPWLAHLLIEQHPDQQCQRVLDEQGVSGGVSSDVKGHGLIFSRFGRIKPDARTIT